MPKIDDSPEYISRVTLIILGNDLDPAHVSRMLKLRPSKVWKRGDSQTSGRLTFDSTYSWGGWKKFLPAAQNSRSLPSQLRYWARTLRGRERIISALVDSGHRCTLDCYIGTDTTASLILPTDLQQSLSALGLDLTFSVSVHEG